MEKKNIKIKPRVSVVCVCYNHVDFIERTIQGFLKQKTTFPYDIIIGDDFSTDGTVEIIENYYNKNKDKITPIFRNRNIGGGNNLINCLDIAKGDYIAYCEGDDYWIDDLKLQKQFDILESNTDIGLVWTDIDLNDLQEKKLVRSVFRNSYFPVYSNFEQILTNKPFFAPSTWLYRKEYANLFTKYLDYADGSFPFILDVIKCTKIFHIDEVTGVYTKRLESASNNTNPIKRFEFAKLVFIIQLDYAKKYNVSNEIIEKISINHYRSLIHYAIIAEDNEFILNANKKLGNNKDKTVLFLLFISRNILLKYLFRSIFKKEKITIFLKNILLLTKK
jgi:glucosyltransferase